MPRKVNLWPQQRNGSGSELCQTISMLNGLWNSTSCIDHTRKLFITHPLYFFPTRTAEVERLYAVICFLRLGSLTKINMFPPKWKRGAASVLYLFLAGGISAKHSLFLLSIKDIIAKEQRINWYDLARLYITERHVN